MKKIYILALTFFFFLNGLESKANEGYDSADEDAWIKNSLEEIFGYEILDYEMDEDGKIKSVTYFIPEEAGSYTDDDGNIFDYVGSRWDFEVNDVGDGGWSPNPLSVPEDPLDDFCNNNPGLCEDYGYSTPAPDPKNPCRNRIVCAGVIVNCECVVEINIYNIEAVTLDLLGSNTTEFGYIDGDNVKIKSEDGTYKKPSQLNPNSPADRRALNSIAASLARGLDGLNKGIIIGSLDHKEKKSSDVPAFTRDKTIFLNTKGGGYSKSFDNVNNLKSIIEHEIFHVDDNRNGVTNTLSTHADVYVKAANDPTYKNTTQDFRAGNAASLANYLLNMDERVIFTRKEIIEKVEAFNKNGTDVKIQYADIYPQKGSLQLKIQIGSQFTAPITMTPINE